MKTRLLATAVCGLLLFGCNQAENKTSPVKEQASLPATDDKAQLQQLVRRLYEWNETKNKFNDFEPVAVDSVYVGLDLQKHQQRLLELKQTGFFADEFIDNYHQLALQIDKGLRSKKLEWLVGDMPPFGSDANAWCNCQDTPTDDYWRTITLTNVKLANNAATFGWTWGGDFNYRVKAVKQRGEWRISYLDGFDPNDFVPAN